MYKSLCSILTVESADREMYRIRDKSDGIAAAAAATDDINFLNFVELYGLYHVNYWMTEGSDPYCSLIILSATRVFNINDWLMPQAQNGPGLSYGIVKGTERKIQYRRHTT